MDKYLVVTMHQFHASLKMRLLPHSFFKYQRLSYLIRSFKEVVPDNSIIRNQASPLSICPTALARFDPQATLASTFVGGCGPTYAFTKVSVPKPSVPHCNHALQPMQL